MRLRKPTEDKRAFRRMLTSADQQAKLNGRGSGRELEKGYETALASSGRGSKRETEKGGAILLTSNWIMNEKE